MRRRGHPLGRLLLALSAGAVLPGWGGARGAEGAPPAPGLPPPVAPAAAAETTAARALAGLASPFLLEREEAAAALVGLGALGRTSAKAAWTGASPPVRSLLARVLGSEGSREAYDALRDALLAEKDPAVARGIVRSLIVHPDVAAKSLEAVRGRDGGLPAALAPVEALVRRARVERLFLSRKSRSGSTGSYPGQYDVLRPERALAVELCLAILRNVSVKEPSLFPAGSWSFLREPDFPATGLEFRHMAANALAELVEEGDTKVLDAMESLYFEIRIGITDAERRAVRRQRLLGRGGLLMANAFKADEGLLDTGVLPTLARHRAAEWRSRAEARIDELERDGEYDSAAGLCLRLGDYGRAVGYFRAQLRVRDSPVLANYNIACAFSRWSLDESEPTELRERYRSQAVRALVASVAAGYADWPWIEQDRDLDAIRGELIYKTLVSRLKAEYPPRGTAGGVPEEPPEPPAPESTGPAMGRGR